MTCMNMARRPTRTTILSLSLLTSLFAWTVVPASAQNADDEKRVEVHVKTIKVTDSDSKEETRVLFIDEDGNQSEFHGKDFDWVSASGDDHHVFINRNHGGTGAFLGVQMTELTNELRDHFGVPRGQGVMVSKVVEGSPAFVAGVRVGDVITGVDGEAVSGAGDLGSLIGKRAVGEQVALQLYRDGKVESMSAALVKNEQTAQTAHHQIRKQVRVECEGDDCQAGGDHNMLIKDFDCGSDECELMVNCTDDGCECTVNGKSQACSDLGVGDHH